MKHSIKKTLSMLLAACFLFGAIGCAVLETYTETAEQYDPIVIDPASQKEPATVDPFATEEPIHVPDSVTETEKEQIVEPTVAPTAEPMPVVEQVSDAEIMRLFWNLMDDCVRTANNGDYESFRALYYDSDESTIRQDFQYDWRKYDNYDRRDGFVACSKNGYYWIIRTHYIVSGTHPNTRRSSLDGFSLVHYENGKLQFAYGDGAFEALGQESDDVLMQYWESIYPGYAEERNAQLNGASFINNNYLFMNSELCYSGSYDTNLIMMWQAANGDVKAAVWYANGTNVNIGAYQTSIKVTDDALGTVIDVKLNELVSVRAGHSLVHVFTIPASQVRSGAQNWTSMHSDITTRY